jgi:hypothetical protein
MTAQTEITAKSHRRAVRFFWGLLIGATMVSLTGNVVHAILPYIPRVIVQIGTAAVPPIALLAAVHGIALAVRAGASGRVYRVAVSAVAAIGAGAFAVSFLALRDLMQDIGYSGAIAWIFPAIIDTAVAVSTLMLVALGYKPARRARTVTASENTQPPMRGAKTKVKRSAAKGEQAQRVISEPAQTPVSVQPDPAQTVQGLVQTVATRVDADLASELIASRVTTQPVETVIAVLAASRDGASINAAAKASGINYRTAQRIVDGAAAHRQRQLIAVG